MAEFTPVGDDGKSPAIEERLIWNGRSIYQFSMDQHKVFQFQLPEEWPAPPSLLRLPFFYRMSIEEAKREFTWQLLKENQDRILLKVTRVGPAHSEGSRTCFLELEKKTFRPVQMVVNVRESRERKTFKLIDIKINTVLDTNELTDPCLDAWKVVKGPLSKWIVDRYLQ